MCNVVHWKFCFEGAGGREHWLGMKQSRERSNVSLFFILDATPIFVARRGENARSEGDRIQVELKLRPAGRAGE